MKTKSTNLLVLIFIIFSFSCGSPSSTGVELPIGKPISSISFQLDNETPNFSQIIIQYYNEENEEYLFLYNEFVNKLSRFSVNNGQLKDTYSFSKEGDKGVGTPKYFRFVNNDTILFSQKNVNELFMSNLKNTSVERVRFNFHKDDRGSIPFVSDRSGIVLKNNKLFLTSPMVYTPSVQAAPDMFKIYDKSNFIFNYDLNTDSIIKRLPLFPKDYSNAVYSDYFNYVSQEVVGEEILYSFPLSDSIIVSNTMYESNKTVFAGFSQRDQVSSLMVARTQDDLGDLSSNDQLESFLNSFNYDKFMYDKYRKIYYRFVEFAVPNQLENIPVRIKPLGILIFDENFNRIGEFDLGYGKYVTLHSFVSKNGLNLVNYEKIQSEESSITFDTFDFSLQK